MGLITRAFYDAQGIAERYGASSELACAESALIADAAHHIKNQPVLEIGVGAGRTTECLKAISGAYFAIDFSERMLRNCRGRHALVPLALCDARAICFRDSTFQMASFFFNGLDDVGHTGRLRILREVWRVLRPGGVFLFSAHNLDSEIAAGARKNAGFAIIHESSHGYRLPTYYVRRERQISQLESCRFHTAQTLNAAGRQLAPGEQSGDPYLYYSAIKRHA